MSTKALESTLHKTNEWIESVRGNLGAPATRDSAYITLRAVLHALRDRLSVESVAHLGAQMPMLLRGLYYEGWHPAGKPLRLRHAEEFLALIDTELKSETISPERGLRAVIRTLEQHLDPGAVDKLVTVLPKGVRELWQMPIDIE